MERKLMSKDNKLSWLIIAIFFFFIFMMGMSSCSSPSAEMEAFNKGKQAAHKQYEGLSAYLVSFEATVDSKAVSGSKVILALNDGIALSHYRVQVVEMLGFSKIENLSFECNEFEYEALIGPDVKWRRELR